MNSASCVKIGFFMKQWRRGWDSNPRYPSGYTPLAGERLRPLGHLSGKGAIAGNNHEFKHFTHPEPKNLIHQQDDFKKGIKFR